MSPRTTGRFDYAVYKMVSVARAHSQSELGVMDRTSMIALLVCLLSVQNIRTSEINELVSKSKVRLEAGKEN